MSDLKTTKALVEADSFSQALIPALSGEWDGKEAYQWLLESNSGQHKQMEWPGFFGERKGISALPPESEKPKYLANTRVDYVGDHYWDFKVHNDLGEPEVQLNSYDAIKQAIQGDGMGFILVRGDAKMDLDGSFKRWHDEFKGSRAKPSLSGRSRQRKKSFTPTAIEYYWLGDTQTFDDALDSGSLKVRSQGRQQSGRLRASKVHMHLDKAHSLLIRRVSLI